MVRELIGIKRECIISFLFFLFIVVGQKLCFRLHVRCSFYHSIHKDNGGHSGTQSQVKKFERDLEKEKDFNERLGGRVVGVGVCNHSILPLFCTFEATWGFLL